MRANPFVEGERALEMTPTVKILCGDNRELLKTLPDRSVHCCITSPPYFNQRDYGTAEWEGGDQDCDHVVKTEHHKQGSTSQRKGRSNVESQRTENFRRVCKCGAIRKDQQIGLEILHDCLGWATGDPCGSCYVCQLVAVFRECRRVLRDDGTLWLNLGDKYSNDPRKGRSGEGKNSAYLSGRDATLQTRGRQMVMPAKNLMGMPWRVAFALQADGWILRSDVIWHRVNSMPGSQKDRPTCNHEYVFLFAKQSNYYYDAYAVKEPLAASTIKDAASGYGWNAGRKCDPHDEQAVRGSGGVNDPAKKRSDLITLDGRSKRTVWSIPVAQEKESHFAVFPPKLVLPCLLAGTSEKGVCPGCGTPYRRITEAVRSPTRPGTNTKVTGDGKVDGNRDPLRHVTEVKTVGWEPGCKCNAGDPVPATVLDPFGGSGTTAAVAVRKNRSAVILELNPEYVEIAKRKIRKAQLKRGFGL